MIFLTFLTMLSMVQAHEVERAGEEIRVLHQYPIGERQIAYVVAREDGHLLGQPFQVELRVSCQGASVLLKDLPIVDSFSVCDLDPQSLRLNKAQTAVALKTKMADVAGYDDQVAAGVQSPEVHCAKPTVVKKFSLRNLCGK